MGDVFGGFGGYYAQAKAQESQGKYQKQSSEFNKSIAELQAEDALKRGNALSNKEKGIINQAIGVENTSYASQGVDVNSTVATQVNADTQRAGILNAITIKNNAWREAWGFKAQAIQYGAAGKFAELAGNAAAENTLLTGGLKAFEGIMKTGYDVYSKGGFGSKGGGGTLKNAGDYNPLAVG